MSGSGRLTVVIPTRDRPERCAALLGYLRRSGVEHDLQVADSSDGPAADRLHRHCLALGVAHHRSPPGCSVFDKLISLLREVRTPYTVMLPDDDVPLPRAIEDCVAFLEAHRDHAAAWGYVLDYVRHGSDLDVHRVRWFTPSVDDATPLERVYHLVRRYQPFFWAVFRTDVLLQSMEQARMAPPVYFQEMTMLVTAAMSGKVARLPVVYQLRSPEPSLDRRQDVEPAIGFLHDPAGLLTSYRTYRDLLADHARRHLDQRALGQLRTCTLEQFLDLVHGITMVRELDPGVLNHAARRELGADLPRIQTQQPEPYAWAPPTARDLVRSSAVESRRYVWRAAVLEAEPREEITIGATEMNRVEAQLDLYESA